MSRAAGPRRWPDLMIGSLVLLLLGGFGTLLLKPQASAPSNPSATETQTDSPPVIPGAPGATDNTGGTATTPLDAAPTTNDQTGTSSSGETTTGTDATAASASTDAGSDGTPVIPAAPIGTPDPALTGTTDAPQDAAATPTDEQSGTAQTDSTVPAPAGAVPTSAQRTPLRSDYRITLGTFSSAQAAQQAAQGVSAIGYTVYPIDLGSQVVAQVGPFADETTARQALADVQRAYPGAVLYPPRGRSLDSAPASTTPEANSAGPSSGTSAAPTPAAAADIPAPAASDGPTYLQVGAFDRLESAQNLVQQLRDLGYNPTVNAPTGKKVTVLVGPYTGDPLTRTETRLRENGLDSFRVR